MRALLQRVSYARVRVAGEVCGEIGPGICVLVAVTHTDTGAVAERLARRVWHLRVLDDGTGSSGANLADKGGEVLVVSQFTLYGDTSRGRRPSWSAASPAEHAEPMLGAFVAALRSLGARVSTGVFGAHMEVELCNDGPVTVILDA